MCLDRIVSKKALSKTALKNYKNRVGYKLFLEDENKLYGICFTDKKYKKNGYPINRWVQSKTNNLTGRKNIRGANVKYDAGFHIFLTREDASSVLRVIYVDKIEKVKFRNISCIGVQESTAVVVAREMIIK